MWLPFPFPQCPDCREEWAYSYHRDCVTRGRIELDPDVKFCRCEECEHSWPVWQTEFHCLCGHVYGSDEVDGAIRDITATLSMMALIVEQNEREARRVRQQGQVSLRLWIEKVAYEISGAIGSLLGRMAGNLARIIFGS